MEQTTRSRVSVWCRFGRTSALFVAVVAGSAFALAPAASATTGSTTASQITTAKNSKLGTILVAGDNAVYTLKAGKAACDASCLAAFPPVLLPQGTTTPTAGSGVDASKLGTMTTASGDLQITYNGKPLYWYAKDKSAAKAADVSDKWGKWSTVVTKSSSGGSGGGKSETGTGGTAF
jgi:predicted lipoprotein with Yx(FWY)xxD motif